MADLTITTTSVAKTSGSTSTKNAAETVTAGDVIYETSQGTYGVASNDDAAKDTVVGIALNGAATGQPVTIAKTGSIVNVGATLAVGTWYVLSASGAISPIADQTSSDYVALLGYGLTTSTMQVQIINTGLQAA